MCCWVKVEQQILSAECCGSNEAKGFFRQWKKSRGKKKEFRGKNKGKKTISCDKWNMEPSLSYSNSLKYSEELINYQQNRMNSQVGFIWNSFQVNIFYFTFYNLWCPKSLYLHSHIQRNPINILAIVSQITSLRYQRTPASDEF